MRARIVRGRSHGSCDRESNPMSRVRDWTRTLDLMTRTWGPRVNEAALVDILAARAFPGSLVPIEQYNVVLACLSLR
jgi:hypothetical protein